MKHINFEQLLDYVENKLNSTEHKNVQIHLNTCNNCQTELELAYQVAGVEAKASFAVPKPSLVKRTMAAFRRQKNRSIQLPSIPAILDFDSWTKLAPMGVRGLPQEHQMLYSVDDGRFDIDLQIFKDEIAKAFAMRGQILANSAMPFNLEGIELRLRNTVGTQRYGLTDPLGCFSFTQLSAGDYSLKILFDEYETLLASLSIKH